MPLDLSKPIRAVGWPDKVETVLHISSSGHTLLVTVSPESGGRRVFFVNPETGHGKLANRPDGAVVQFENLPEPTTADPVFVNIYSDGKTCPWDTQESADKAAGPSRIACAKIKMTVTSEGQILTETYKV